jgi:plastocyanin
MATAIDAQTKTSTQRGDRFVATSALLVVGLLVLIQILARHVIPPLAIFGLTYAVLGVAALRSRNRWIAGVAIVLGLLYVVGSYPFYSAVLAHPDSPAGFVAESFLVLAATVLLIGGVTGMREAWTKTRRPMALSAGALAIVAVVVALAAAAGVETSQQQPGDVIVEAERSLFTAHVDVAAGGALWVENRDLFHHTLVVEGTDVHVGLPARKAVRVEIDLAPGTYRYFCDVPGHETMEGELVVR